MDNPAKPPASILVVDDDRLIRKLLESSLTTFGYAVVEAADTSVVPELLRAGPPDLVITDLHMAKVSGLELLADIRNAYPGLPVIIMSGDPNVEKAVECIKAGAANYLAKPFTLGRLKEAIEKALAEARRQRLHETLGVSQPRNFAGYRIIRTLGRGSVGIVYLAEKAESGDGRRYALKVLKELSFPDDDGKRENVRRFYREAEIAASIRHPSIRAVFEYGVYGEEQTPYLVMEYIEGTHLKRMIEDKVPLTYLEKTRILRQVADALHAVHCRGACHRDVKPTNIIVGENLQAKLTDFGVARILDSELTAAANFVGTPAYAAPEAFASSQVDHRADIFSLGVVAYELFFRQLPFDADNFTALANQVTRQSPKAPHRLDPDFPEPLQEILAKMLRKNREHRYGSAGMLVTDMDAFLNGTRPPHARSLWQSMKAQFSETDWS